MAEEISPGDQSSVDGHWDIIYRWANNGSGYLPDSNGPITDHLLEPKVPADVASHWRYLLMAQGFVIVDNADGTQTLSRPAGKSDLRLVEAESA
jgi:hypothetical protein